MQVDGDSSINESALQEAWQLEDELREAKEELRQLGLRCHQAGMAGLERKPFPASASPAFRPEVPQEPFNLEPPPIARKQHDSLLEAAQSLVSNTGNADCTELSERLVAENLRLESEMQELQHFIEAHCKGSWLLKWLAALVVCHGTRACDSNAQQQTLGCLLELQAAHNDLLFSCV